jgi:hypothetical protein
MSWDLTLSFIVDERFLPAVRDVATLVARRAGFAADEAARVGRTVDGAAAAVMRVARGQGRTVDLRFDARTDRFEVSLRYVDTRVLPQPVFDRGAMDCVAFSREGAFAMCCLTCKLPVSLES